MKSNVRGVGIEGKTGKWTARAFKSETVWLGTFDTEEEAIKARKTWEIDNDWLDISNYDIEELIKNYMVYSDGTLRWTINSRGITLGNDIGSKGDKGYININFKGRKYKVHRMIWFKFNNKWPKGEIDHKNGIRDANTLENLRDVPKVINGRNQRMGSNNTSGYNGVARTNNGRWKAQFCYTEEGKQKRKTKVFDLVEDAIKWKRDLELLNNYHENHGSII